MSKEINSRPQLWHKPWKPDDSCTKSWFFVKNGQRVSTETSFWNDTQHGFAKTSRVHNVIIEKGETTNTKIFTNSSTYSNSTALKLLLIITFVMNLPEFGINVAWNYKNAKEKHFHECSLTFGAH